MEKTKKYLEEKHKHYMDLYWSRKHQLDTKEATLQELRSEVEYLRKETDEYKGYMDHYSTMYDEVLREETKELPF